jgi:hypothetical protein
MDAGKWHAASATAADFSSNNSQTTDRMAAVFVVEHVDLDGWPPIMTSSSLLPFVTADDELQ